MIFKHAWCWHVLLVEWDSWSLLEKVHCCKAHGAARIATHEVHGYEPRLTRALCRKPPPASGYATMRAITATPLVGSPLPQDLGACHKPCGKASCCTACNEPLTTRLYDCYWKACGTLLQELRDGKIPQDLWQTTTSLNSYFFLKILIFLALDSYSTIIAPHSSILSFRQSGRVENFNRIKSGG